MSPMAPGQSAQDGDAARARDATALCAAPRERPILFRPELVREILAGRGCAMNLGSKLQRKRKRVTLDLADVAQRWANGATAKEIAAAHGCSVQPVRCALRKMGLRRPAKPRPGATAGDRNHAWSGGRRIRPDGYVVVWTTEGERLEHRVVAENALGRPLTDEEVVHHRDGNKANNSPENLEVTTQSEHARHHMQLSNPRRAVRP